MSMHYNLKQAQRTFYQLNTMTFSSINGVMMPLNNRLLLTNLSATDMLMQMLLNELAVTDVDDETLRIPNNI
eukprot:403343966